MSARLRPRGVSRDKTPWIPRAGDSMGVGGRSIQLPVLILFYFPDFRGLAGWGGVVPPCGGELIPGDSRPLPRKHTFLPQTSQSGAPTPSAFLSGCHPRASTPTPTPLTWARGQRARARGLGTPQRSRAPPPPR